MLKYVPKLSKHNISSLQKTSLGCAASGWVMSESMSCRKVSPLLMSTYCDTFFYLLLMSLCSRLQQTAVRDPEFQQKARAGGLGEEGVVTCVVTYVVTSQVPSVS